jgi:pimeloyl-ACP methyl ester carboxylesterase/DNA-binding CsgD family transcriptional regulator
MNAPRVQFATTADGVRIAFTSNGEGPPVFWLPHFLASHVQMEWEFPQGILYSWLGERCRLLRFDARGLGLSERNVEDLSTEARFGDIEAVAAKAGAERFSLIGIEGGGNLAALYAAAHPERVDRLVLINWSPLYREEVAKGRLRSLGMLMARDWELLVENVAGAAFGYDQAFAVGYSRLVKATLTQEMARRYGSELVAEDPLAVLPAIDAETLVVFSRNNQFASEEGAQTAAATIPNASYVEFEGGIADHIQPLISHVLGFLPAAVAVEPSPVRRDDSGLTLREREILARIAKGMSNREVADDLSLSHRTVERHLENVYRKTGTRNRAEATAFALQNGLF